MSSSIINPSWGCRNGLEVRSAALNEVSENLSPVVARIPSDFSRWVDFDRYNLGGGATLNDDNKSTNAAVLSAALLSALNVSDDEGIPDIGPGNNMGRGNGESTMGFYVVVVTQVDEEGVLPNVGGHAFQLESLEASPSKECRVCRSKLAKVLGNILVGVTVGSWIR